MHISRHITSTFNFNQLLSSLIIPHIHDSTNKRNRRLFHAKLYIQPVQQLQSVLRTINRQIMNHLSFSNSFFQILLQIRGRTSFRHSHPLRFLTQGRLDSHPYNMIHSQLIPEDNFLILIHIDNGSQPSIGQAEKIKKSRILAEMISIILIVHATLLVA